MGFYTFETRARSLVEPSRGVAGRHQQVQAIKQQYMTQTSTKASPHGVVSLRDSLQAFHLDTSAVNKEHAYHQRGVRKLKTIRVSNSIV